MVVGPTLELREKNLHPSCFEEQIHATVTLWEPKYKHMLDGTKPKPGDHTATKFLSESAQLCILLCDFSWDTTIFLGPDTI